jgi:hypothetical protein
LHDTGKDDSVKVAMINVAADWKSLSQREEDPKTTELVERRETLTRKN